jgi:hypothetical protein
MEEIDQVVHYSLGGNLGDCRMVTLSSEKTSFEFCFQRFLGSKVVGSGTNLQAKDGNRGEVLRIMHQFRIN